MYQPQKASQNENNYLQEIPGFKCQTSFGLEVLVKTMYDLVYSNWLPGHILHGQMLHGQMLQS